MSEIAPSIGGEIEKRCFFSLSKELAAVAAAAVSVTAPLSNILLPRHDRVARILSSSTTNDARCVRSPARRKRFILLFFRGEADDDEIDQCLSLFQRLLPPAVFRLSLSLSLSRGGNASNR